MSITRLSYRSRINFSTMTLSFDEEIERILSRSRTNNAKADLSGALLLAGNTFLQMIEGPEPAVLEALDRISADPRHGDFAVIDQRTDTARLMPADPLFFCDASDACDSVLSSLYIPIAHSPELVRYDDLVSVMIFSATRVARRHMRNRALSA